MQHRMTIKMRTVRHHYDIRPKTLLGKGLGWMGTAWNVRPWAMYINERVT